MTDTELLILNYAAQNGGEAWPLPRVQGDVREATHKLIRKKLLGRKRIEPIYDHFDKVRGIGTFIPVITNKGCDALNLERSQRP